MGIIRNFYPAVTVKRKPPVNVRTEEEIYFGGPEYTFTIPESGLYSFRKAIVSHEGIVFNNYFFQKEFITCYKEEFYHYRFRYFFHVFLKCKKMQLPNGKKYLLLFDHFSMGFFHWLSDGLTRMIEMKDELQDYTVLIPSYFKGKSLYEESFEMFGIKQVCYIPEGSYVSLKNLFIPSFIAESGNYHPENVKKLRTFAWEKNKHKLEKKISDRIYISRRKAKKRYVENEKDVESLLSKYGFTTVCMEDYDFSEQISFAYNAQVVISMHGAALALTHFMKPGSQILELRRAGDAHNNCYFSLASELDIQYYYEFGESVQPNPTVSDHDANIRIDINNLEKTIRNILHV